MANSNPYLAVAAVTTGIATVSVGNGLLSVFVPVRMALAESPALLVGAVVTAYSVGFLLGCLRVNRVITAVGHVRAFAGFAGMMSIAGLALALDVAALPWTIVRFAMGFCAAGLFTVAESWLADRTPRTARGRVFGAYMIATKTAFGAGQLLLILGDAAGFAFFMVAAACYSACLIPVALSRSESPSVVDVAGLSLVALYRMSPVAVVGCFVAGMNNSSVVGIGPIFAAERGLNAIEIAWFAAAVQIGGLLLQYPVGRLADRMDRRLVVLGSSVLTIALAATLLALDRAALPALLVFAAVYGAVSFTIYPVCAAHAADRVEPRYIVAVSGALLLAWAAGSVVGPLAITLTLPYLGGRSLFQFVAVVTAGLALFIVWRVRLRPLRRPTLTRDRVQEIGRPQVKDMT